MYTNNDISPKEYLQQHQFVLSYKVLNTCIFQDASAIFGETCLSCSNYSATYFVGSKNIKTGFGNFDLSIGYAFDFKELKAKDYKGVFGGVSFTSSFYDDLSILFEHNSKGINTGFKLNLISKFNLMFGIWDLEKPTFAFNYLF